MIPSSPVHLRPPDQPHPLSPSLPRRGSSHFDARRPLSASSSPARQAPVSHSYPRQRPRAPGGDAPITRKADDPLTSTSSTSAKGQTLGLPKRGGASTPQTQLSGLPSDSRDSAFDNMGLAADRSSSVGVGRSPSRASRKYLESLSKEDMAVVELRFDLMSPEELKLYLEVHEEMVEQQQQQRLVDHPISLDPSGAPKGAPGTGSRSPGYYPGGAGTGTSGSGSGGSGSQSPLFPPSPPLGGVRDTNLDHPLRILSKAVRELREAVDRLERENRRLRAESGKGVASESRSGATIRPASDVPQPQLPSRPEPNPVAVDDVPAVRQADQISIHEDLTEALSTSLNVGTSLRSLPATRSLRSSSPTPSGTFSIHSAKSIDAATPTSTAKRPHRSSWTSGLWVWSGGHGTGGSASGSKGQQPRRRKGSVGSMKSQGSKVVEEDDEDASGAREDAEQEWRKGDGGSSPAFRAIFLATRTLTPEPSSILVSPNILSTSLIAHLAHSLISNARDMGITARDPPGRRRSTTATTMASSTLGPDLSRSRSRATSTVDGGATTPTRSSAPVIKTYGDSTASSIGRALLSSVSTATVKGKSQQSPSTLVGEDLIRPSLLSRASSSRAFPTTVMSAPLAGQSVSAYSTSGRKGLNDDTPLPSMELSSIVPDEARPPTVLLSRQNLGSFFQSSKKMQTASRFNGSEPPLTDRYGFIYDVQHVGMLKGASVAGMPAPASLNGTIPPVQGEGEGWIQRQRQLKARDGPPKRSSPPIFIGEGEADGGPGKEGMVPSPLGVAASDENRLASFDAPPLPHRSSDTEVPIKTTTQDKIGLSPQPVEGHRHRASTLMTLNPSPARPVIATDTVPVTVSARGSASLHLDALGASSPNITSPALSINHSAHGSDSAADPTAVQSDAPKVGLGISSLPPPSSASRMTISSLLDQLLEIHDIQQKERKIEWDAFLRRRAKARTRTGGGSSNGLLIGINEMGLRKSGSEDWKVFTKLVRGGVPLAYRSDIWLECSGARDMMVPGEYAEILSVHKDDISPALAEIEKDVSRTFPGNVFFGGDGPGVAKLRRVLVAYSWYNPEVGYCQGMNMLAATLLLTHTEEEQAYWTLVSLLHRLLPGAYYTPNLLSSRADQLVLSDLVTQLLPKLHAHLQDLGVELSSVTFGWFLSLFTDCLPVETLFRVWDVMFVDGHTTLFRVAISILKLNEAEMCACESVSDLFTFISSMTSRLWAADKLIAIQHSYKPIIRHADIKARCERRLGELALLDGEV